jgi:outer membrane protein OmpU
MNKLTKVGFSALCGSLAAVASAHAGSMTVTGGADMTWISKGAETTGNPIGIGSNLTFKGSGELDNGWTFAVTVANLNGSAYSATDVNLTMGGLGSINFNQGNSGNGIDAFDDKMPTAWEEAWGAGLSTGVKLVSGVGPSMNVQYTTPTILGITLTAATAPAMGVTDTADVTTASNNTAKGKGYDGTININPSFGTEMLSGLNIFAGGHYTNTYTEGNAHDTDIYEAVAGLTFDLGPISIGYAQSGHIMGEHEATGSVNHYRGNMYGVAFNINDDLSVSYARHESRKQTPNDGSAVGEENRRIEVASWQVAYTMGGASIRIADTNGDNLDFSSAKDRDVTTISLGLAF